MIIYYKLLVYVSDILNLRILRWEQLMQGNFLFSKNSRGKEQRTEKDITLCGIPSACCE